MLSRQNIKILLTGVLMIVSTNSTPFLQKNESRHTESENEIVTNEISDDFSDFRGLYAKQMLSYMNHTVDPCEDFYEYACGNWKNVIDTKPMIEKRSHFLEISTKIAQDMEEILQRPSITLEENYNSEFKLAQRFYDDCLNADLITIKQSSEYLAVIKSIGGFPAVDDAWDPAHFSWFNMSAHLTNYGVSGLINEMILQSYPFYPLLKLPELGFDFIAHKDNILSNTSRAYTRNENQMRKYLKAYGVSEIKSAEVITEIFQFWKAVLNVADQFDELFTNCSLYKLDSDTEEFEKWDNYFDIAWMGKNFDLTPDSYTCNYFYSVLNKICENHKYAVANYLALKFLHEMESQIESRNYQKDYCLKYVHNMAGYLLDKIYLKEYLTSDIIGEVAKITKEVKKNVRSILKEADWLDEETRTEALLKESTIISRIGKYDNPVLIDKLIREMNNLTFVVGNYEKNNINVHKFKKSMGRYISLRSEDFDNTTKPMELNTATQINAFYFANDNSINIMAGIFNPPSYHQAWPYGLKFGTLGYLIGHELTHAYDTVGSEYDSQGFERSWWSQNAYEVFQDRADCFIKHFDEYLIPEIGQHIDGKKTEDENIADSGGLRAAFTGYTNFMKEAKRENQDFILKNELMPGMNFSLEQLFFLGFGQLWCSAYREEHLWKELTDAHAIDKYRVLGALKNFDKFALAFECPKGSNMNPKQEKCRVW